MEVNLVEKRIPDIDWPGCITDDSAKSLAQSMDYAKGTWPRVLLCGCQPLVYRDHAGHGLRSGTVAWLLDQLGRTGTAQDTHESFRPGVMLKGQGFSLCEYEVQGPGKQ